MISRPKDTPSIAVGLMLTLSAISANVGPEGQYLALIAIGIVALSHYAICLYWAGYSKAKEDA